MTREKQGEKDQKVLLVKTNFLKTGGFVCLLFYDLESDHELITVLFQKIDASDFPLSRAGCHYVIDGL